MRFWLSLLINCIWSSRLELAITTLVIGVLSVGQGKELILSLQGAVRSNSLLAIMAVSWFACVLGHWTYVTALAAPVHSHWFGIWQSESDAGADPRLGKAAVLVATLYPAAILAFVLLQFILIGETAGIVLALASDAALVFYLSGVNAGRDYDRLGSTGSSAAKEPYLRSRLRRVHRNGLVIVATSLVASPLLGLLWILVPPEWAFAFGSFGTAFLSFSILVPWLFLFFLLLQGSRLPVALILLLAPFIAETSYDVFGLHANFYAVRTLEPQPNARPEIDAAAEQWAELAGNAKPVVFVTAAGGGIRAAYWTAAVLGHLEDCISSFHQSVFSISAVSGGSLGAAAFVSLVANANQLPKNARAELRKSNCGQMISVDSRRTVLPGYYQNFLKSFLSQDYLAPVVREALLGDIPRSLNPWSSSSSNQSSDRGIALETAWEDAWNGTCAQNRRYCSDKVSLGTSFSSLAKSSDWLPLLFLNGVHEETGKRLITSTAHVVTNHFLDATDFFDLVERDVRTSTAILNSARFPIISPSGRLFRPKADARPIQGQDAASTTTKHHVGHVVDGGYFDNNGTVSSQEIAAATMKPLGFAKFENACAPGFRKAIFLEILNDTAMTELDSDRDNLDNDTGLASRVSELSILTPEVPFHPLVVAVNGLESSRAARAVHSSKTLARYSRSLCGSYYFMMPLCRGIVPSPALGWMLSEDSRAAMDKVLVGGIDTTLYERRPDKLNFYDCYNLVQSNLAAISDLLR